MRKIMAPLAPKTSVAIVVSSFIIALLRGEAMPGLDTKLMIMAVIWYGLVLAQCILGPMRRRSGHRLVQYGAMAAYYFQFSLAFYAVSTVWYSSNGNHFHVELCAAIILGSFMFVPRTSSMSVYTLGDCPFHGWRFLKSFFYILWAFAVKLKFEQNESVILSATVDLLSLVLTVVCFTTLLCNISRKLVLNSKKFALYMKSEANKSSSPFFPDDDTANSESLGDWYPIARRQNDEWIKMNDLLQFGVAEPERDFFLSYSFFQLLKRRCFGFRCAEKGNRKVCNFVLKELLPDCKAFTIVEVQLALLHDYFFASYDTRFLLDMPLFARNKNLVSIYISISQLLPSCMILSRLPVTKTLSQIGFAAAIFIIQLVIWWFQDEELLATDWYKILVDLECCRTNSMYSPLRPPPAGVVPAAGDIARLQAGDSAPGRPLVSPALSPALARAAGDSGTTSAGERGRVGTSLRRNAWFRQPYWKNKLGQYSLLQDYDRCSANDIIRSWFYEMMSEWPGFIEHDPVEEDPLGLPDSVRESVAHALQNIAGPPTSGTRSLWRNGVLGYFRWTFLEESHTHTMLIWHVATCFCEMNQLVEQMSTYYSDYEAATALSRYCAYLVAFLPKLLPGHWLVTKITLQDVLKEARATMSTEENGGAMPRRALWKVKGVLGLTRMSMDAKHKRLQTLADLIEDGRACQTTFEKGVRLGRKLSKLENSLRWKVMAEFWAETMLYVAPSDDVAAHVGQLANGGEFVTHLWALLSNAGILKRATEEWSPPPGLRRALTL